MGKLSGMRITRPTAHPDNHLASFPAQGAPIVTPDMSTSHPPFDHRAGHDAPEHEKRVERRDEGRERGARVATMLDIAVLIGALLVALAVALVLQTQLELGWELSVVAGLAVFAIAASLHILLQRT